MKRAILLFLIIISLVGVSANEFDFTYLKATMLNQDPDPAQPGQYLELRWKIEKLGNTKAEDLAFTLDIDHPFFFDAADTAMKKAGNWVKYSEEEEYFTLYYKVRVDDDAIEGTYKAKLMVSYNGLSSDTLGEFDLRVGDNEKPDFVLGTLSTDPIKLVGDTEEAKIEVELENIGKADAENVKATIILPEGFVPTYSYSDRENLGTISAGSSKTATYYVDIAEGVAGGLHEAKLEIEYKETDDQEYRKKVILFDLPVKDKPVFDVVSVTPTPSEIHPGDDVSVRIKIENTGGKEGESVSVRAFKDSSQPFSFDEKSDFIGKLKPGETGDAIILLGVDDTAESKGYQLDLEIRSIYEDEVLVQEKRIMLDVVAPADDAPKTSPVTGMIIVVVIVLAGVGGYYFGRKK